MRVFADDWARCAPWIEAALGHAHGTHTLEDVHGAVIRGDADFWAGRNAAMVTEVVTHPQFKTFNFWLAGGDLAELRDELRPQAETYARLRGAKFATITGRPGWARALGYKPLFFTCAKELT